MSPTLEDRLAVFPTSGLRLQQDVQIRWNAYAIPYIQAASDDDAAYALGMCHVHLRSAQMHIMKRIAQGRVAEMLGPLAVRLDHALRLLDLNAAAARCEQALPDPTRAWLEPFVRGLNDYQSRMQKLPPEFGWLAMRPEPWTIQDVLCMGRLMGADVNWASYLALLKQRNHPRFADLWKRLRIIGGTLSGSRLARSIAHFSRSGSNSVVIAGWRTASGSPLIANDPHLGQTLPNFWLLAALQCPGYHMTGFMPPGLPFVGVGAGPHMCWGGTNMRAASSDLVDVSSLPDHEIHTKHLSIRVRGLGTRKRRIRRTAHGPILNDAAMLKVQGGPVALRWMGHAVSDEIGAFLSAARAQTPAQFRAAFRDFGVCAQNILFATRTGDIGHVYAAHLPRRKDLPESSPILDPAETAEGWEGRWDASSLPMDLNPECGFRVSANDRPKFGDAPLGIFFSEGDRAARLAVLADKQQLSVRDMKALQQDTVVPGAATLARELADLLETANADHELIRLLRIWDGDYAADSRTPVALEALLHELASALNLHPGTELDDEWGRHTRLLLSDLAQRPMDDRQRLLKRANRRACKALSRYPSWGHMHRLSIHHLLHAVPVLGRNLKVAEWGAGGTRESVMKNSHGLVRGKHPVQYGAQARHISDLSDMDANYFALLGGNDGWINSENYADQLALWRSGEYVKIPLSSAAIAESFPIEMSLSGREAQAQSRTQPKAKSVVDDLLSVGKPRLPATD
tara:strand:+ start:5387 stop:7612 length:2226 start_codon:yes stop_codon:yes gene_type:complete